MKLSKENRKKYNQLNKEINKLNSLTRIERSNPYFNLNAHNLILSDLRKAVAKIEATAK